LVVVGRSTRCTRRLAQSAPAIGVSQWRSGDVGRATLPQITQRYGPAVVNISVVSSGKASADDVAQADRTTRQRCRRRRPVPEFSAASSQA
jgi:hypothetical protein